MTGITLITECLQKHNVNFEIKTLAAPLTRDTMYHQEVIAPHHLLVGVMLVVDGKMQLAVVPADRLLDSVVLAQHLGVKKIQAAVVGSYLSPFSPSIWGLPPLPALYGVSGLIDRSIRDLDIVAFSIPNENSLVTFSGSDALRLFENDDWNDFTHSLVELINKTMGDPSNEILSDMGLPRYTPRALRQRLNDRHEFPIMSETAQKILRLQSEPDVTLEALSTIVQESPTLAAQVIKWANSPYYGFPQEIKTIRDAIVKVLGFDLVINMALGIVIGSTFNIPMSGPIGLRQYWQHSIVIAALNERLVRLIPSEKRPLSGLAYLTGLLHNFGFLLLGEVFPKHFALTNQLIPVNPHCSIMDIEHAVLGVAHDQLGSWLMESWHLPVELVATARYHHWLDIPLCDDATKMYVALTHLSVNLLASHQHGGDGSGNFALQALTLLELDPEKVEQIFQKVEQDFAQLIDIADQLVHVSA